MASVSGSGGGDTRLFALISAREPCGACGAADAVAVACAQQEGTVEGAVIPLHSGCTSLASASARREPPGGMVARLPEQTAVGIERGVSRLRTTRRAWAKSFASMSGVRHAPGGEERTEAVDVVVAAGPAVW